VRRLRVHGRPKRHLALLRELLLTSLREHPLLLPLLLLDSHRVVQRKIVFVNRHVALQSRAGHHPTSVRCFPGVRQGHSRRELLASNALKLAVAHGGTKLSHHLPTQPSLTSSVCLFETLLLGVADPTPSAAQALQLLSLETQLFLLLLKLRLQGLHSSAHRVRPSVWMIAKN
jgi:hypothetical protein